MANEISFNGTWTFGKGGVATKSFPISFKATWTGVNYKEATQVIPTTAGGTALDVTGLSNVGMMWVKNNDSANPIILLNAVSGTDSLRILAGESYVIRFDTSVTAPAALAVTASISIQYCVIEI